MAEASQKGASLSKQERLGVFDILRAGWRLIAQAGPKAWLALLGLLLMAAIEAILSKAVDLQPGLPIAGASAWTMKVLLLSMHGLAEGFALRLLAGTPSWRLDRGMAFYVLAIGGANLVSAAGTTFLLQLSEGYEVAFFLVGLLVVGLLYVYVRLLLWPVAHLLGRPHVTAKQAWTLMRHVWWRLLAACALVAVVLTPLRLGVLFAERPSILLAIADAGIHATGWLLSLALTAAVFLARERRN